MNEKFFTLREVELNNHCPECYSTEGLKLTFKQRFIENTFYRAITTDTSHSLFCNVCETIIFPARWNDDIERVFEYQQRGTTPKSSSIKLKKLSWVLIVGLAVILLVAVIIFVGVFGD